MCVIFATYLQNVTTLPWKMANKVRAYLGVLQITGSNMVSQTHLVISKHVHRIVKCIEQLVN